MSTSLPRSSTPKVPEYAWGWLQRSRTVMGRLGDQLYGQRLDSAQLEQLKRDYIEDGFVRDIVARVVCEVTFSGRVPEKRPPGVSWDRGLTWWAAHLAGVGVREFEARSKPASTPELRLFGEPTPPTTRPSITPAKRPPLVSIERRAMVHALHDLIRTGDGEHIPVAAVKDLIRELENPE